MPLIVFGDGPGARGRRAAAWGEFCEKLASAEEERRGVTLYRNGSPVARATGVRGYADWAMRYDFLKHGKTLRISTDVFDLAPGHRLVTGGGEWEFEAKSSWRVVFSFAVATEARPRCAESMKTATWLAP